MRSLEYTTLLEHGSRHVFPYLCPLGKSRLLQPLTSHIFSFRCRYIPDRYHRVTSQAKPLPSAWYTILGENRGLPPAGKSHQFGCQPRSCCIFSRESKEDTNNEQFASDLQCMGSHNAVVLRAALRSKRALQSPWLGACYCTIEKPQAVQFDAIRSFSWHGAACAT